MSSTVSAFCSFPAHPSHQHCTISMDCPNVIIYGGILDDGICVQNSLCNWIRFFIPVTWFTFVFIDCAHRKSVWRHSKRWTKWKRCNIDNRSPLVHPWVGCNIFVSSKLNAIRPKWSMCESKENSIFCDSFRSVFIASIRLICVQINDQALEYKRGVRMLTY